MSDFNLNENTLNKLKNMMNNGELNDVISKIPPEMIQNFSSMMQNSNTSNKNNPNTSTNQSSSSDASTNQNFTQNGNSNTWANSNFDFNNIDMNTILKMKSVMEKMNLKNDPRSNLLYSLKPYLREGKREKLDQYANLLNVAKIADLLKNDNKENKDNG